MKLLPSWRAVLPLGPEDRAWPWVQQPRSKWALWEPGLGQQAGSRTRDLKPSLHELSSLSAWGPSQVPSASSRPHGLAGPGLPEGDRLGPGLASGAV